MKNKEILEMKEQDILKKLMGDYEVPTGNYTIKRLGIPIDLKGLKESELKRLRKECMMKPKKVNGRLEEKLNSSDYDAAIIVAATTNFDWNSPQLVEQHSASDGKKVVQKLLLPGEITNLVNKILELSGFNDDIEEVDEDDIKNSSSEEV